MARQAPKKALSRNAANEHVHTPEAGEHADDALFPGAFSGSGDVEHVQREAAMAKPEPGAQSVGEEPPSHPETGSRDELERIRRRNLELLSGAKPSTEGERSIAGIRTEHSGPPHSGDYSND